ncbi:dynactin P62 subunit [Culex quinquefasciatus]|uniref:Dynactin P62 subunit n=1 Tax=Culex quinquefasciatus TaxID=7176 RepID=B0X8A1_CULQU|nr:dynactin P62 subunit [Culex quinquefasciatus]|eukprot:XP_001865873.1 dynactin P62 subunit [Culex quinquefasciatus]
MVMLRSVFWAKMRPEVGVVKGHLRRVLDDNPNLATDSAGWKIPGIYKPVSDCNGTSTSKKQNPTGVRKRHAEEEQLLVAKRTSAGVVHEEGKHERSNLRCDWAKIAILFLLYQLQGIPIGLAAAIPMMLQNRGASYKHQPAQYLIGLFMLFLSLHVNRWLGNSEEDEVVPYIAANIPFLTGIFFTLNSPPRQSHPLTLLAAAVVWFTPAMIYDHHPAVDGTYMELLNTLSNLGGNWPITVVLWNVDVLTAVAGAGVRVCDSVWTAAAVQSVVFEQVSELDGSNRADGVDGPSADGWTDQIEATPSLINRSIASEAVDELPEDFLTKPIQQKIITTRQQRLAQPAKQPFTMNKLYPQPKLLSIKRSLRCRQCDHNLINPTINDMIITIMELSTDEEERLMIEELKLSAETTISSLSSSLTLSVAGLTELLEDPRMVQQSVIGTFRLHFFNKDRIAGKKKARTKN